MVRSRLVVVSILTLAAACGGQLAPEDEERGTHTHDPVPGASSDDAARPGGSSTGNGGTVNDATPLPRRTDLALQHTSKLACQGLASCGISGSAIFTGTYGDEATCLAKNQDRLEVDLARDGVTVTQAQLDACAARQALEPCQDFIAECMFTGALRDGAACTIDGQCASGSCRYQHPDKGVCVPLAPAGGACTHTLDCGIGLGCNKATKKCASPLPGGAACEVAAGNCGPGLACLGGVCSERLPVGATCDTRGEINFGYYDDCVGGAWCESRTHVCTPFPKAK